MHGEKEKTICLWAAAALVFTAVVCRFLDMLFIHSDYMGLTRSAIYIFLYAAWTVSVRNRIIHVRIRRYLTAIAAFMVFWFLARTVKYYFSPELFSPHLPRYLWYLYYLPMLFIPMLGVLVAVSLGKPEDEPLPGWAAWFSAFTAFLVVLVLTNDLHQLVFTFPPHAPLWTDADNGYGPGYVLVAGWLLLCALLTLAGIWQKCRIPFSRKRIWQPVLPVCMLLIYTLLYYSQAPWLRFLLGDMTAVFCLMYAATLELCIHCALIPSNTHYREMFDASTVGVQITDENGQLFLSSAAARPVPEELLKQAQSGPVMLDKGLRLCAADIRGGHVFWQEDVSELLSVLSQLNETKEELQGCSALLEEENRQKQRRCALQEQNRLLDAVQQTISPAKARLAVLLRQLDGAEDAETARLLHGRIAVVGAYLKRRSNLVFLADQSGAVPSRELLLCLNESAANLRLTGTACAVKVELEESINGSAAGTLYDFFEAVVEEVWADLPALNVVVSQSGSALHMLLMLQSQADLSPLALRFPQAETDQDEDVCYCRLTVEKEGART